MPPSRRLTTRQSSAKEPVSELDHRELLAGFVRLHILHHAANAPIIGFWIIEELARHGYRLSPGTLYPMLRAMELRGYLRAGALQREGQRTYRPYTATKEGLVALQHAKEKLRELFHEVIEEENEPPIKIRPGPSG